MIAHYMLQEHHVLPGELRRLMLEHPREYAFVKASCLVQGEHNKKQLAEQERQNKKRRAKGAH